MTELPSWHRPGQKVAVVDGKTDWLTFSGPGGDPMPVVGEVYTIRDVILDHDRIWLTLNERDIFAEFQADWFRPVYPSAIDQLRRLETPVGAPERVLEEV